MCNRFVQKGREVRPGQRAVVLMRGPGGEYEVPFDEAIFGGPARSESRNYWIKREGAEHVLVPEIVSFGEKDKATGRQNWETLRAPAAMEGLLLPKPPGKDYRLLKVLTQAATAEQMERLGNDRVPVFPAAPDVSPSPASSTPAPPVASVAPPEIAAAPPEPAPKRPSTDQLQLRI